MSTGNYQRVAQREGVTASMSTDSLDANVTRSLSERLMDKLVAGKTSHRKKIFLLVNGL